MTIGGAQRGYLAGEFTFREVVEAYLQRIRDVDQSGPELNSVITAAGDALVHADEHDAHFAATGSLVGALHGVPIVVKDQV